MFVRETSAQIIENYVKPGHVRMVYRDVLIPSHESAELAAVASRCAGDQGQFWPFHDRLFATHGQEWGGVPRRDTPVMVEFARQLGLDEPAFTACLADPAVAEAVRAESAAAGQSGINATPGFLINGYLVLGARPYAQFEQIFQQLLAE